MRSLEKTLAIGLSSALLPMAALAQSGGGTGVVENPSGDGAVSGVSLVSGWHCSADEVQIQIDDREPQTVPVGSERADTAEVCGGTTDTGYGLLVNFNLFGEGQHTLTASVNGEQFAQTNFTVATLGSDFLEDVQGTRVLQDFPETGKQTIIEWKESEQNFSIVEQQDATLNGTYELDRVSLQQGASSLVDSSESGVSVSGTMTINGNEVTQDVTININGSSNSQTVTATCELLEAALDCTTDSDVQTKPVLVQQGDRLVTSLVFNSSEGLVNEIDYWEKVSASSATASSEADEYTAASSDGTSSGFPLEGKLGGLGFANYDSVATE